MFLSAMSFVLIASVLIQAAIPAHGSQFGILRHPAPLEIYRNIPDRDKVSGAQCFESGFLAMDPTHSMTQLPADVACGAMTDHHRRFLALEITRCHMVESAFVSPGGPLSFFVARTNEYSDEPSSPVDCNDSSRLLEDEIALRECLSRLEDNEFDIYTRFFCNIEFVCLNLAKEQWQAVAAKSAWAALHEMNEIAIEQANVRESINEIVKKAAAVEARAKQNEMTILDEQQRVETIFSKLSHTELTDLNKLLESASEETEKIHESLRAVASYIQNSASAFTMLLPLLYFLATINVLWILTSTKFTRSARPYVIAIAVLRGAIESLVDPLSEVGNIDTIVKDFFVFMTRVGAVCSVTCILLIAIVWSSLVGTSDASTIKLTTPYDLSASEQQLLEQAFCVGTGIDNEEQHILHMMKNNYEM